MRVKIRQKGEVLQADRPREKENLSRIMMRNRDGNRKEMRGRYPYSLRMETFSVVL